jgi:CheY-like chemotaxis protein
MDIMLKGKIDGIKAAEKIYNTMDIPVVYLTAYSDDKILERSKKTNPYGYLTKPFEEKTLQNTIKVALDNYRKEKEKKE